MSSNNIFALAVLANRCVLKTRSEMRQRLEFKKKLFELAADKFYSEEKVLNLMVFLEELLTLPLAIQAEFEQFYNQILNKKFEEMPITQFRPKGLLKLELNREYGMTLAELNAQLEKAKITEQLEQNLEDKEKVIEDKENELHRVIIKLHTIQQMTAEQIADFLERPLAHILQVLQSAKI
ncbi:MAG: hypothetical protein HC817_10670 [Saprospiraceae bacterium]|nr:hypothetical protein [Saprospiraceae bacterium]